MTSVEQVTPVTSSRGGVPLRGGQQRAYRAYCQIATVPECQPAAWFAGVGVRKTQSPGAGWNSTLLVEKRQSSISFNCASPCVPHSQQVLPTAYARRWFTHTPLCCRRTPPPIPHPVLGTDI